MATDFTDILQDALAVEIPDQVRHRCRQNVMAGAERILAGKQTRSFKPGTRRSLILKPVALAAALFTLLSAGTAWAATGADPDSMLYPVKQRLEEVRTSIAMQNIDQARVQVAHAQTRLDEIETMVSRDQPDYVPTLFSDYDSLMADAAGHLRDAAAQGEDTTEVESLMVAARTRHDELLKSLSGSGSDQAVNTPGGETPGGATGATETGSGGTGNGGDMGNNDAAESHSPGDNGGSDTENTGQGSAGRQEQSPEHNGGGGGGGDTESGGSDSHQQDTMPPSEDSGHSDLENHQNEQSDAQMPGH